MPTQRMKAKIALIGDAGVGKTSLVRRFVLDEFSDKYQSTLGTKVLKVRLTIPYTAKLEVEMDLTIYDMVGDKSFRDLIKDTHFHDIQGILAVCDITNAGSLSSLSDWLVTAQRVAGEVPTFLVVNKNDLAAQAKFGDAEVGKFALPYGAPFLYTSAKSGEGVDDAFNSLALEILSKALPSGGANAPRGIEGDLLAALDERGLLGLNKADMFGRLPGVRYEDLKIAVETLEREGLAEVHWKGPADFSVFITDLGRDRLHGVTVPAS